MPRRRERPRFSNTPFAEWRLRNRRRRTISRAADMVARSAIPAGARLLTRSRNRKKQPGVESQSRMGPDSTSPSDGVKTSDIDTGDAPGRLAAVETSVAALEE